MERFKVSDDCSQKLFFFPTLLLWNTNITAKSHLQLHTSRSRHIGQAVLPSKCFVEGYCIIHMLIASNWPASPWPRRSESYCASKSVRMFGTYWLASMRPRRLNRYAACQKLPSCARSSPSITNDKRGQRWTIPALIPKPIPEGIPTVWLPMTIAQAAPILSLSVPKSGSESSIYPPCAPQGWKTGSTSLRHFQQ